MRKIILTVGVVLCMCFSASAVFAADAGPASGDDWTWRVKPSVSVGYAFGSDTRFTFTSISGVALVGATKMDIKIPSYSGLFTAAELPIAISDRWKITLAGKWASQLDEVYPHETYNNNPSLVRNWDMDKRDWLTVDALVSYAVIKRADFFKEISPFIGFRYDYYNLRMDNPHSVTGIATAPVDTLSFRTQTIAPIVGVNSTFRGYRSGIFGGDIKLGILVGPYAWSNVKYNEKFADSAFSIDFKGSGKRAWFYSIYTDITLLSGKIGQNVNGSIGLFAQFNDFYGNDDLKGTNKNNPTSLDFKAKTHVNMGAVGLRASIAF
jgi:hypothetical protein